jgi:hypothetical protein
MEQPDSDSERKRLDICFDRLNGEIAERTQRQLEVTSRLVHLERCVEGALARSSQVARETTQSLNAADTRIRDLEAQVAAVWALVELTDGYGSPFWSEPGLDDTTPAQAVAAVLEHLRSCLASSYTAQRQDCLGRPGHREAMAALNAADRQSDDDQICGC